MSGSRQRRLRDELRQRFETLAQPCHPAVYRAALRLTRDPDRAADLTQEAFVRAFEKFYQFVDGTNFKAWVTRILVNTHIAEFRRQRGAPTLVAWEEIAPPDERRLAAAAGGSLNPEDALVTRVPVDRVRHAVAQLPEPFRTAVILADMEELPYDEISRIMAVPIGTVRSRIARGRKLVMHALQTEGDF